MPASRSGSRTTVRFYSLKIQNMANGKQTGTGANICWALTLCLGAVMCNFSQKTLSGAVLALVIWIRFYAYFVNTYFKNLFQRRSAPSTYKENQDLISNFSPIWGRIYCLDRFTEQFCWFVFAFRTLSMQISIGNIKIRTVHLQPKKTKPLCAEGSENIKL